MTRVAVLGTGLLGSGFAEGLLSRGGTDVVVWNRNRAKAEALVPLGATVADTPAAAVAGADRVHLVLLDDDAVDATIEAFLHALDGRTVIVDHTTTRPDRTAARASALDAAGKQYLHAPVMMGPGAAREAKGMMMVAGPAARVALVHNELAKMTGELWHVGERADLASAYKLFGNATLLSLIGVLADVMRLADASGVPRAVALQMVAKVNLNGSAGMRGAMMANNTFTPPSFTLDVARKDLRLMLETAGSEPTPMLRALAERMDEMLAVGHGSEDFSVLGARR